MFHEDVQGGNRQLPMGFGMVRPLQGVQAHYNNRAQHGSGGEVAEMGNNYQFGEYGHGGGIFAGMENNYQQGGYGSGVGARSEFGQPQRPFGGGTGSGTDRQEGIYSGGAKDTDANRDRRYKGNRSEYDRQESKSVGSGDGEAIEMGVDHDDGRNRSANTDDRDFESAREQAIPHKSGYKRESAQLLGNDERFLDNDMHERRREMRTPLPEPIIFGRVVERGKRHQKPPRPDVESADEQDIEKEEDPFIRDSGRNMAKGTGPGFAMYRQGRGFAPTFNDMAAQGSHPGQAEYNQGQIFAPTVNNMMPHRPHLGHEEEYVQGRGFASPFKKMTGTATVPGANNGEATNSRPLRGTHGSFRITGARLNPSRSSGARMPWRVNNDAATDSDDDFDDENQIPADASLLKRQLNPTKSGKKGRSAGANDPENIRIVNMRDDDGMRFDKIASILNAERIGAGREPSLTTNSINGRYNRTAPLLYAAAGKVFMPPGERRRRGFDRGASGRGLRVAGGIGGASDGTGDLWSPVTDTELVRIVKEYDESKWERVATAINLQYPTMNVNPGQCAVRFGIL